MPTDIYEILTVLWSFGTFLVALLTLIISLINKK
ncbi:putative holin-like toxin [Thalassobacillus hwangdonensis]|uniref:Holin-like toxin n=1 Tax=Thalassobacillus hwangdonensis TaxID=546108 RepID=A0ABW3KZ85_9BACI